MDEAPPSTVAEAPSTQATAEASVAARATAAVAPTELELQIWLRPSAAVVRMDGKLLELPGGPFRVQCTGTTTLRFEAEGYQPKTRTVTCGGTAVLDIVLEKQKP